MYLTRVQAQNIRSIRELEWSIEEARAPGWHVVLGNNGAGKSSFLRGIALALVGPEDVHGLRQAGDDWLRKGETSGHVSVVFTRDGRFDRLASAGAPYREYGAKVVIVRGDGGVTLGVDAEEKAASDRSVWAPSSRGWFSAGFGPYRRFTGGEGEARRITASLPRLARYLSLFDEQFALSDTLDWLVNLKFAELASKATLFSRVKAFVNQQGFLPHDVTLDDVTAEPRQVVFVDAAGAHVPVQELSDGFRSVLSLTLELLRQLVVSFGEETVFASVPGVVEVPGVVLIDEVDAHLHPTWQRTIGQFFTRAFPAIQFVVSTHSPLVCQSAERGSIYLLPDPGADGTGRFLEGDEKQRLVLGNVLDAFATGAFGENVGQSEVGREKLERLAALNAKELDDGLDDAEAAERELLRKALPSRAAVLGNR